MFADSTGLVNGAMVYEYHTESSQDLLELHEKMCSYDQKSNFDYDITLANFEIELLEIFKMMGTFNYRSYTIYL